MDSVLLGMLIRLKFAAGGEVAVFPGHFISEAKLAIKNQIDLVFEWYDLVDRLHFLGAYCRHGDPAYNQLNELFSLNDVKGEQENSVIVLSGSQSQGPVRVGKEMKAPLDVDYGEVSSNPSLSVARRKFMFGKGSPLDWESTNKKPVRDYVPDAKGKLEMKVDEKVLVYCLVHCHQTTPRWPTLMHQTVRDRVWCGGC